MNSFSRTILDEPVNFTFRQCINIQPGAFPEYAQGVNIHTIVADSRMLTMESKRTLLHNLIWHYDMKLNMQSYTPTYSQTAAFWYLTLTLATDVFNEEHTSNSEDELKLAELVSDWRRADGALMEILELILTEVLPFDQALEARLLLATVTTGMGEA